MARMMRYRKRCIVAIFLTILMIVTCANFLILSKMMRPLADDVSFLSFSALSSSSNDWCKINHNDGADIQIEQHFHQIWKQIDDTIASDLYKNSKVSGGIFLYPRQTFFLMKLIQGLSVSSWAGKVIGSSKVSTTDKLQPIQVCETGFGSGHSTALFLSIGPNVNVLTFDKFDRPYQLPIVEKLKKEFGSQLEHRKGNSCKTVPKFFKESQDGVTKQHWSGCDILHGSSLCPTDNIDLVQHTECGTILTSTAMHSISDRDVYFGPKAQWRKLRRDGCISDISCFNEETKTLDKSFVFATKNAEIFHEFCFAIVTGMCHFWKNNSVDHKCTEKISNARALLKNVCQDYSIPVPNR